MITQKTTETVTVEELAIMVAKGFKETNNAVNTLAIAMKKGFDGVDRRFNDLHEEMDERFSAVDKRFDTLEAKFDALDNTIYKNHAPRLRRVERKLQIA